MIAQLEKLITAHYPIIFIQSYEWYRINKLVSETFEEKGFQVSPWNHVDGLVRGLPVPNTKEPLEAIRMIHKLAFQKAESEKKEIFLLHDYQKYLAHAEVRTRFIILSNELKYCNKHILILGPVITLVPELEKEITILEAPLPTKEELRETMDVLIKEINHGTKTDLSIDEKIKDGMVSAALGLTMHEADLAFSRALVETKGFSEESIKHVIKEKEQIIRKSKILEYYHTNKKFSEIGGLGNLKKWLNSRANAFTKRAREFGLSEPKGVLLTGVPGCGKSLIAKAIASIWNMPLLRFDIGKVFEGLVGSSEQNMRKAISTAEGISPCILWIDEIEKGLSGIQSSGSTDSGVTSRVFSTFLTWMQEKEKPVFIVATANKLNALPPELLRKGRFDEIFFVDLPAENEREEIFKIHVEKQGRKFKKTEYAQLAKMAKGFNGAEIEAVVKEAMFTAFDRVLSSKRKTNLQMRDVSDAITKVVPLSVTRMFEIAQMRELAKNRFVPASHFYEEGDINDNDNEVKSEAENPKDKK